VASEARTFTDELKRVHEAKVARVRCNTIKGRKHLDKGQREALGAYKQSLAKFVGNAMLQESQIGKSGDGLSKSKTIEQPGVIEMLQSPEKRSRSQGLMHLQMLQASKDISGMGNGISEIEKILQVLGYTDDRYFRLIEVHLKKIADH
jgi:CRP-like cAMP-binding protein